MLVFWPASSQLTAVTAEADDDTLTKTAHGLLDGDAVFFLEGTGFTGLTAGRRYFVRDKTTDTFKLAATAAGAAINITLDGTAGVFAAAAQIAFDESYDGAPDDRLEGALPVESVREWESVIAKPSPSRTNRTDRLPLSIPRLFDSEREAGEFFLEHYAALANAGPLLVVVGHDVDTSDRYTEAVLESCIRAWGGGRNNGRLVLVDYLFQVGTFSA